MKRLGVGMNDIDQGTHELLRLYIIEKYKCIDKESSDSINPDLKRYCKACYSDINSETIFKMTDMKSYCLLDKETLKTEMVKLKTFIVKDYYRNIDIYFTCGYSKSMNICLIYKEGFVK